MLRRRALRASVGPLRAPSAWQSASLAGLERIKTLPRESLAKIASKGFSKIFRGNCRSGPANRAWPESLPPTETVVTLFAETAQQVRIFEIRPVRRRFTTKLTTVLFAQKALIIRFLGWASSAFPASAPKFQTLRSALGATQESTSLLMPTVKVFVDCANLA